MTITAAPAAEDLTHSPISTRRANYTALLIDVAGLLRRHPEIPEPYFYSDETRFNVFGEGAAGIIATIRRAIGGTWDKEPRETEAGMAYLDLKGQWHGFAVTVTTSRDVVCKRVVTGTREVTKTIPDPEALAKVPQIEVTETERTYEWVCEPLLAPRETAESADEGTEAA